MTATARIALFASIALALAPIGCTPSTAPTSEAGGGTGKGQTSVAKITVDDAKSGAVKFAAAFVKSVREGSANPAQLSVPFKKIFAPAELEADKPLGYSDAVAVQNLKLLAKSIGIGEPTVAAVSANAAFLVSTNEVGGRTMLRLTKGSDWLIDGLSVSPGADKTVILKGDDAPAQYAVQAFIDAVQNRRYLQAEAMLTDGAKKTLGKGTFGDGFDRGALVNKFDELLGYVDEYSLVGSSATGATVEVKTIGVKKTLQFKTAARSDVPATHEIDGIEANR